MRQVPAEDFGERRARRGPGRIPNGLDAAGVLKALAHHARHASFEAFFHLADDFGIRLAHRGDPPHDRQPPLLGQPGEDFRPEARRQMRHHQRNRLRVLVDDVGDDVLPVDVAEEGKRHRLDRLANRVERGARARAERPLQQRPGHFQAAAAATSPLIADAARLKAAYILLDTAPLAEVEKRLTPLADSKRPFALMAKEALATARLMAGQADKAKTDFAVLSIAPGASAAVTSASNGTHRPPARSTS